MHYAWHEKSDVMEVIRARRDEAAADGAICGCVYTVWADGPKAGTQLVSATACGYHDADLERTVAWKVIPAGGTVAQAPADGSHSHVRWVCRVCGSVYRQCRCPAPHKRTEVWVCPSCVVREKARE